jgi:hypothetical protein
VYRCAQRYNGIVRDTRLDRQRWLPRRLPLGIAAGTAQVALGLHQVSSCLVRSVSNNRTRAIANSVVTFTTVKSMGASRKQFDSSYEALLSTWLRPYLDARKACPCERVPLLGRSAVTIRVLHVDYSCLPRPHGGKVLVACGGPVRPAAALRDSVLCLPTDIHCCLSINPPPPPPRVHCVCFE